MTVVKCSITFHVFCLVAPPTVRLLADGLSATVIWMDAPIFLPGKAAGCSLATGGRVTHVAGLRASSVPFLEVR